MQTRSHVLVAATLVASWLGMQAVHELGHVLGAAATGGRVTRVVLAPWTISRTDLAENPSPQAVAWAGPACGATAPLLAWCVVARTTCAAGFVVRFFAGFCLIANGLYLGVGSFFDVGDAGDLLRTGAPAGALHVFGLLAVPAGLALWHGLGPHFGRGPAPRPVETRVVGQVVLAAVALAVLGVVCA